VSKVRILIVDDHPLTRSGLKSAVSGEADLVVVGEAVDGNDAIAKVDELKPDLVIMDITMPGLDGISATKRITDEHPEVKVLILSMHEEALFAKNAFKAGAAAYLLKDSVPEEILVAITRVMAGKRYASPAMANELLSDFVDIIQKDMPTDPIDMLTKREREVLKLIAGGSTNKEIAESLYISVATVKTHRVNLMGKLSVHDVTALVKIAVEKGVL
jgi:two-component system response regulator NreC